LNEASAERKNILQQRGSQHPLNLAFMASDAINVRMIERYIKALTPASTARPPAPKST
jgi:hypothetical protein